jgi:hypothetical protein
MTRPGMSNWIANNPGRYDYWNGWADGVRDNWYHDHWHDHCFDNNWWHNHHCDFPGWHYWNDFDNHNWDYWWTVPAWGAVSSWFNWSATPAATWSEPVYYDYGSGGNVVYDNNVVYVNNEQVASAEEFAQSAMALATVPPPASQEEAAKAQWMPLGTFAVSTSEKDAQASRVLQLAVNKEGVVAGTLSNAQTDQAVAVQGQVDKETQRVAFRVGTSEDVVAETGLYNLTQDAAPVLVHFGPEKVENYLLVRLDPPTESAPTAE